MFQASDIGFAAYCSDWLESTEGYKRSIRILIARVNKPLKLVIAGFYPMSVESFAKVSFIVFIFMIVRRNRLNLNICVLNKI